MPDGTGAVPSQLAIEKGHRLLGLHLAEHRMREVRPPGGCPAGVGGGLAWQGGVA
jgi:hypothetical protein